MIDVLKGLINSLDLVLSSRTERSAVKDLGEHSRSAALCTEILRFALNDKRGSLYQHVKEHHRKGLFRFDDAKEERILNMPFMPNYAKFDSA